MSAENTSSSSVGDTIGPYHVLAVLGEGGMGTVLLCEQKEPVRRRVALKVIKLGMDSAQVLRRFELERQALAVMSHDSIARVFDCGTTARGQPYFVMEYVKGLPITDYCDQRRLGLAQRLDLFQQVCAAVQHAHQKGVVHRDLKPGNVLVTDEGGKPVPKVIDFGLARATDHLGQQESRFTEFGSILGTPEYMSPEQADGRGDDIDTRTDIYSLGVMLYELLTGQLPFSAQDLRKAGFREMLRMIREVEPPRPSTRLSTLGDAGTVAAARKTSAGTLRRALRGELDWVVLKALEKDRTRRYESASALARDVARVMAGEVIEARPPSATYRLRKFVRRNRAAVLGAGAVVAALVVGVVGFAWQAEEARGQRDRARAAETQAAKRADELAAVASYQAASLQGIDPTEAGVRLFRDLRARHTAALGEAKVSEAERTARTATFVAELGLVNATDAAVAMLDESVLAPATRAIATRFADQPLVDAALRTTLGDVYLTLGRTNDALDLYHRGFELRRSLLGDAHRNSLASRFGLGKAQADLQQFAEAEAHVRATIDGYRSELGDDDPRTLAAESVLAHQLSLQGRYDESEQLARAVFERRRRSLGPDARETLDAMDELGAILTKRGKYAEAVSVLRDAVEAQRRVGSPDLPATLSTLGGLLHRQRELAEAETCLREALAGIRSALGEDHPKTAAAISSLASVLMSAQKLDEAEALAREGLTKTVDQSGRMHADSLKAMNVLGQVLFQQGRYGEAEEYYREALETGRWVLGEDHPDTIIWIANMGSLTQRLGRSAEARVYFAEAIERNTRKIGASHPYTRTIFRTWIDVLRQQRDHAAAETALVAEIARIRREDGEDEAEGILLTGILGSVLRDQNRLADADVQLQRAVAQSRRVLGDDHPDTLLATLRLASLAGVRGEHAAVVDLLLPLKDRVRAAFPGMPGELRHATTLGMLGRARAGLARDAAERGVAEADLLAAQGTFAKHPGVAVKEARDWTQALVDLYVGWHAAEPGRGYDAKAAEWQKAVDALGK